MGTRILIVDDEVDLLHLVRYNLEKEGFEVLEAYDGRTAMSELSKKTPDLIVLDLMLPDISGFKLCREIKSDALTATVPIIMLTARSSEIDRISGFEAGADDYVVKPFSPKELVLRIKALLARIRHHPQALPKAPIDLGKILVYPDEHRVETRRGRQLPLSLLEFKILLTLAQNPNVVKTREQLIMVIWEQEGENINDRAVDTHIKRLRQKLGSARDIVETIRGVGYRVTPLRSSRSRRR